MARLALGGVVLAIIAGAIWANAGTLGIEAAWPVVFGFALAPLTARRRELRPVVVGVVTGVAIGWAMFAIISAALPFIPVVFGVAAGVSVGVLAMVGALWRRAFSIAGMFGGFAAFVGLYEPTWIANRANFLPDGATAAAAVLLGLCGGMLISAATGQLLQIPATVGAQVMDEMAERRRRANRRVGMADRRVAVLAEYYGADRRVSARNRRSGMDRRVVAPAFAMAEGRAS